MFKDIHHKYVFCFILLLKSNLEQFWNRTKCSPGPLQLHTSTGQRIWDIWPKREKKDPTAFLKALVSFHCFKVNQQPIRLDRDQLKNLRKPPHISNQQQIFRQQMRVGDYPYYEHLSSGYHDLISSTDGEGLWHKTVADKRNTKGTTIPWALKM